MSINENGRRDRAELEPSKGIDFSAYYVTVCPCHRKNLIGLPPEMVRLLD